jgi:Uri superfamily endonuclease
MARINTDQNQIDSDPCSSASSVFYSSPYITIGGDASCRGGVYVLHVRVAAPLAVVFGRFQGGRPVPLPAGDYFYVGSALNGLAARLLRHASRSQVRSPALQRALPDEEDCAKALNYEPTTRSPVRSPALQRALPADADRAKALNYEPTTRSQVRSPALQRALPDDEDRAKALNYEPTTRSQVRSPALQRALPDDEDRAKALNYEPHFIRDELAAQLATAGLPARPPAVKRLHWHIDYLLDEPGVALAGVWAWRTAESLEGALAGWLAAQPGVVPLAAGLGASDDRGRTHLLRVASDE